MRVLISAGEDSGESGVPTHGAGDMGRHDVDEEGLPVGEGRGIHRRRLGVLEQRSRALGSEEQGRGARRSKLHVVQARDWFAVENAKSKHAIMKHDWDGADGVVSLENVNEAKALLCKYFTRVLQEDADTVAAWITNLESANEVLPLKILF